MTYWVYYWSQTRDTDANGQSSMGMTIEDVIEEYKLFYICTAHMDNGSTKYAPRVAGPCKREGAKFVWDKQA
jgi:hypothetical protein